MSATMTLANTACLEMLLDNEWRESIEYYVRKIDERVDLSPTEHVVVLLNADDPNGKTLADILMPYREAHVHYARGITLRRFLQKAFDGGVHNPNSSIWDRNFSGLLASQLRAIADTAIVVMDFGTIAVFDSRLVLS